jgi:hypothetical protein
MHQAVNDSSVADQFPVKKSIDATSQAEPKDISS